MAGSQIAGSLHIDASDFKAVVRALRRAEPVAAREIRKQLRAGGEIVAVAARRKAGQHSKSIPGTIKVRTAGTRVEVRAGAADKPLAGLYEVGNRGGGSGNTFRHPVFGNRQVWVEQPRYPFLKPAALESTPLVERQIGLALQMVADAIVLGR